MQFSYLSIRMGFILVGRATYSYARLLHGGEMPYVMPEIGFLYASKLSISMTMFYPILLFASISKESSKVEN